jgi:hypothetical protein
MCPANGVPSHKQPFTNHDATKLKLSRKKVPRAEVSSTAGNIQKYTTNTKGQCISHYKQDQLIDQTMSSYQRLY